MTSGQTRVLVLLACLFGLQALINPTFRGNLVKGASGNLPPQTLAAGFVGSGAAAVALVALAAPAPKLATWIVVLFIGMALLTHASSWTGALDTVTRNMNTLFGSSLTSAPSAPTSGGQNAAK